jgi:hypothetical protein
MVYHTSHTATAEWCRDRRGYDGSGGPAHTRSRRGQHHTDW